MDKELFMQQTREAVRRHRIIVILRGVLGEQLRMFAHAAFEGGIRLLECTYNASAPEQDELIAENIAMLASEFGGELMVGAGTVLTERQVELTAKAGGRFIISPDFNPDIVRATKEQGMLSIPGVITPTEVAAAHRAGADAFLVGTALMRETNPGQKLQELTGKTHA